MKKAKIFFAIFIPLLFVHNIKAQTFTDAQIKAGFIYKFSNFLEWENEDDLETFRIAICDNDTSILPILRTMQQTKKIKGKPIEVFVWNNIDDLKKVEVIYLNANKGMMIADVNKKIAGTNTLLVSDHVSDQRQVMINFITDENNSLKFEVNKTTISNQHITILPKLLLLGGTEIDVRELYLNSEKSLQEEKQRVQTQQKLLEEQQSKLAKQEEALKTQRQEIEKQKGYIESQKAEIEKQQKEISSQKDKLKLLLANIGTQEAILNEKLAVLEEQELRIKQQQTEVENYNKVLENQKKEIEKQQNRIANQKDVLKEKVTQIETQQGILIVIGGFLFVILILVYFIVKSNKQKQRINNELEMKNHAISSQNAEILQKNEEIEAQKEELESQKDMLQLKNQQISGSIRYAKTIQSAILPILSEMKDNFSDLFVIFKPKDIVSGDFYWFIQRLNKETNAKELYVAAVDCTGHGVPGAFMSMIGNRILNEIVNEKKITSPAEILTLLDSQVRISLRQDKTDNNDGMDVCLCRIDQVDNQARRVCFSGAKRPLYHYVQGKRLIRVKGDRRSIGGVNRPTGEFTNKQFDMQKGDQLYLTTDGFIDQNNDMRKRLGSAKFAEIVQNILDKSMFEQQKVLEEKLLEHQSFSEQRDDITLIGLKL